ncbi:MAG: nuclear transport factor 2 family protein [Polyangiaceae bacterium]|nr:nuclear transport factor 2 family protein [Polyangiaceae bacterium]
MRKISSAICLFLLVGCGSSEQQPQASDAADQPSATDAAQAASPPVATAEPVAAPKRPLAELIKENVAGSEAAWGAKDIKKLGALYTQDAGFATWGMTGAKEEKGPEMLKGLEGFWAALAEVKLKTGRVIQSNDLAISEWVVTATTQDKKTLGVSGVSLMWFADDGRVKREQLYMDEQTTGMQMGEKSLRGRAPISAPASTEWVTVGNTADEKKNVETIKALYGALDKKDTKAFEGMLADDAVFSDMARPEDVKGKAKIKDDFGKFSKAFPDLKLETKQVIGAGKYVVVEGSWTGTMQGQLGPLKASKKNGTIHFVDVFELKDGKVAKLTTYSNGAEFAGAFLPPPPAKPAAKEPAKDAKPQPATKEPAAKK